MAKGTKGPCTHVAGVGGFLDQLERRHCKDTPYIRPFYIGAPNRPFL
jgi:hypothetical protein